ncbi:hypothetical protein LSH36_125g01050 [Paralvinella palmiformis]|uniref:LEM domain-containing protein n=1 Tax=Paralvinella palmiformis TaxID=53620 RepID=A0AAD9JWY1_9ANNE|nr:hypothetical protein LSH36_125g01050 [Paralvinella palmiformis]
MDKIKVLTDEELVARLKEQGQQTGPITASTRSVFQQKLHRCLDPSLPAPLAESEDIISESSKPSTVSSDEKVSTQPLAESPVKESIYYGIQLPPEASAEYDRVFVFTDKQEALRQLKLFPGSRFKPFCSKQDAENFSRGLSDISIKASPKPFVNQINFRLMPSNPPAVESSAFRSVKTQDLVKLRKFLEKGDLHEARKLIWSNPRYLVSSGDTPTILQEGFRYNALHVAAMKNQPKSAQLILETVENPHFMQLLYPGEPEQTRDARIQFLVDLYLNTPDKGLGETALHFACKFGHAEVVKILAAHPKIERNRRNKYEDTPADLICTRSKQPAGSELKNRIKELLQDHYYVHLWRSEDNSTPPHVAEPWSPTADVNSTITSPNKMSSPLSPVMNRTIIPGSPRESPVSIKAVAGPMSAAQAKRFRRTWLTPPCSSPQERKHIADVKRKDSDKGLERIGRNVAHTMGIAWSEYWDFLGCYADFSSEEGLEKLENYLRERSDCIQRQQMLETDLNMVSTKLNQLNLSSPDFHSCSIKDDLDANAKRSDASAQIATRNSDYWHTDDIPMIDDSDNDSDTDTFYTAVDHVDSDVESLFTPPQSPSRELKVSKYFIYGSEPSKMDLDVIRSLEEANLNENRYPHIIEWRRNVSCYKEEDAARWGTPHHIRAAIQYRITSSTDKILYSPLLEPYSPVSSDRSFSPSSASSDSENSIDNINHIRVNLYSSFQSEKHIL